MKIRQAGDPILRSTSEEVSYADLKSGKLAQTISTMHDILNGIKSISDENGNALSAPQVGVPIRLIVLRIDGEFVNIINPSLSNLSPQTFMFEEECFSFYNMRAKVLRHQSVTLQYLDENLEPHSLSLEGEFAGLIQHEVDHLNGIFFLDRVEDKTSLVSIDYLFKDEPRRLKVLKQMCDYMAS